MTLTHLFIAFFLSIFLFIVTGTLISCKRAKRQGGKKGYSGSNYCDDYSSGNSFSNNINHYDNDCDCDSDCDNDCDCDCGSDD